jgi:hypothetical protein
MSDAPLLEPTPLESILGSGAGGPLSAPTPWIQYTGYLQYNGGVVVGNPTGGNEGAGTINAPAIYANGTQVIPANYLPYTGGIMTGLLTLSGDPINPLGATTKQYSDTKVPLSGGTMTGPLIQAADPINPLGSATKQYVDNKAALYLPLVGGTLTGVLTLSGAPTANLQAATKLYVDNAVSGVPLTNYLPLAGGTLTGALTLAADPTTLLQAATKQYVDGRTSGFNIPDAPSDGSTYGRNNAAWSNVVDAGAY